MRKHIPIIIIMVVAAVLLFANLGNQYLWQDEAETAILSENTLEYGYPRAFDGRNYVNPRIMEFYGIGMGKNYVWLYHPWIQFYITALSFLLFGVSTFTARLPFALIGVVNILMLYLLALRITKERFVAGFAAFLMAFSVPYLLMMRQCRYHAPMIFFVLFVLYWYSAFREDRANRSLVMCAAGLIGLCYTVHGIFLPVFAALALHYLIFSFNKKDFPRVLLTGAVVVVFTAPWFILSESSGHLAEITFEKLFDNLEFQVRMINKYLFPMVFFGIAYAVRAVWRRTLKLNLTREEKGALTLTGAVILVSVATFCFAEQRQFRYLLYFIPLLAIAQGMILLRLAKFSKILLAAFLVISVMTGVFNMGYPNFLFPKYLYEITHDYDGPIEGIVKFLDENASADDTVKIIYGDLPLIFYTDLTVDNSWVYKDSHMPRWIVFRRGWHELLGNKYYTKVKKTYKKHVLDHPDIRYENRPGDLGYHKFATDTEAPGVIVFEKVEK